MAHNGAKHSLEVEGRTDRLTDLSQRSQLANGLRQLTRTRVQFLEQPDVFNGNNGLISESFKKLNLAIRERTNFLSIDINGPDEYPFFQHWCMQHRARAALDRRDTVGLAFSIYGFR